MKLKRAAINNTTQQMYYTNVNWGNKLGHVICLGYTCTAGRPT